MASVRFCFGRPHDPEAESEQIFNQNFRTALLRWFQFQCGLAPFHAACIFLIEWFPCFRRLFENADQAGEGDRSLFFLPWIGSIVLRALILKIQTY
jgi:hypothetical protein